MIYPKTGVKNKILRYAQNDKVAQNDKGITAHFYDKRTRCYAVDAEHLVL